MQITTDLIEASFHHAYRKAGAALWDELSPLVDEAFVGDGDLMQHFVVGLPDVAAGREYTQREMIRVGGAISEAGFEAALLPDRFMALALGYGDPDDPMREGLDLTALDGRPAVDNGPRFGEEEGQIVNLPAGSTLGDSAALKDAILEARRRIWNMVESVGWSVEEILGFTVILPPNCVGAFYHACDNTGAAPRLAMSKVRVWSQPRLGNEAFVIAHMKDERKRPFEWKVAKPPTITHGDGDATISADVTLRVKVPATVVRIQPSALVLSGDARREARPIALAEAVTA